MRKRVLYGIYIRRQGGYVGLIGVHGGNVDLKTLNSNGFFCTEEQGNFEKSSILVLVSDWLVSVFEDCQRGRFVFFL